MISSGQLRPGFVLHQHRRVDFRTAWSSMESGVDWVREKETVEYTYQMLSNVDRFNLTHMVRTVDA